MLFRSVRCVIVRMRKETRRKDGTYIRFDSNAAVLINDVGVPLARTRAAELRAYLVVLDTLDRRAFAVDPDGTVICGTFPGFDIAAFTFDRARTEQWNVAPHTDVRAALERVARIAQSEPAP